MEKKRKEDVLEVCLKGLEDPYTHLSKFCSLLFAIQVSSELTRISE